MRGCREGEGTGEIRNAIEEGVKGSGVVEGRLP